MRSGVVLFGLAAACWAGVVISACGSGGSSSPGGTGGHGAASSGTGGSGPTSSGGDGGGLIVHIDAGTGGQAPKGDACGSVALESHLTPGNIVVVFDQSDSMKNKFNDADAGVRAPSGRPRRTRIVAAVTPIDGLLNLGTIFFPTKSSCVVATIDTAPQIPIEPGAMFVTDFQAHFSASGWKLIGSTPLKIALDNANAALPDPSPLTGQRAVVIITDGAPTCTTAQAQLLAPVQDMATRGIKTYAVGLPGSANAATLLNAIAAAGGTGSYLSPGDPAALQDALSKIATNTVDQCTITLDPPPADLSQVHLIVTDPKDPNGVEITQGAPDGWSLSPDGSTATLLGATCQSAKDGGYTSITFVYGCPQLPS